MIMNFNNAMFKTILAFGNIYKKSTDKFIF